MLVRCTCQWSLTPDRRTVIMLDPECDYPVHRLEATFFLPDPAI